MTRVLIVLCALLIACDGLIENDPYVLRVTFNCNKVPKYYDLTTKDFVDDKSGITRCPKNKSEILDYCRKTYQNYDIVNIVHENMNQHFDNWCDNGRKMCYFSATSRVYRCVVGVYFAHAVSVPEDKHCKFDFIIDHTGPCKDEDTWVKAARVRCHATGKHKVIHEYSPLEHQPPNLSKCDADQYQGIQFSCCDGSKTKPNHQSHHGNFFPNGTCDSRTFSHVRTSLLKRRSQKLQHLLSQLKKKGGISSALRNATAKSFLAETQKLLLNLHRQHYVCAYKVIVNKKTKILESMTKLLNQNNINQHKLARIVDKVVRVFGHEHNFLVRQFSHVQHLSPKEAAIRRIQDLKRLQTIDKALADVANILKQFPEIQNTIFNFKKTLIIPSFMFPSKHHNTDSGTPVSNDKPHKNEMNEKPSEHDNDRDNEDSRRPPVDEFRVKKGISTTAIVIIAGGCAIILVATVIIAAVIMKSNNNEPENPMKVPLSKDFGTEDNLKIKCNSKFKFFDPKI